MEIINEFVLPETLLSQKNVSPCVPRKGGIGNVRWQVYNICCLTFISFSAAICCKVIVGLMKSGWFRNLIGLSRLFLMRLNASLLAVTNRMIFKLWRHIISSHLAPGVWLTHVLYDNLCFQHVICLRAGSVLIRPHDFHFSLSVLLTAAHEIFLWIKKRSSLQFSLENSSKKARALIG